MNTSDLLKSAQELHDISRGAHPSLIPLEDRIIRLRNELEFLELNPKSSWNLRNVPYNVAVRMLCLIAIEEARGVLRG